MGLTELGRTCQPMSPAPWTWRACSPLHRPTTFRSRGPPAVKLYLLLPKDVERLGFKSLKSPKGSMSPGVGVPTPGSFFRVTPLMGESNLQRVVLQAFGCVQGVGVRKDEGRQHKPCVFLLAHPL